MRYVPQLERNGSDTIVCNKKRGKQNSTIRMSNTDFEGLYKGKDHIFQSLQNEDETYITKISYYELHVLSIL